MSPAELLPRSTTAAELRDTCVMLAACLMGALAGLALDLRHGMPVHVCSAASGPWAMLLWHWTNLKWMNCFMLAGGALAMLLIAAADRRTSAGWLQKTVGRCGFNLACHASMLASMVLAPLLPLVHGTAGHAAGQMLAAMAASVALVALAYRFMPATP